MRNASSEIFMRYFESRDEVVSFLKKDLEKAPEVQ